MIKFLCDHMCAELGKWLRIAGYDTVIIEGAMDDKKIFEKAVEENRCLITRDKYFLKLDPEQKTVIYLKEEGLSEWMEQLKEEKNVDWLYRPFSRCLKCNSLFEKTQPPDDLPEQIRTTIKEFWECPACHHLFWLGSHTRPYCCSCFRNGRKIPFSPLVWEET